MAEVLPRHLMYSVIIFVLVVVGGVSLLGIMNDEDAQFLAGSTKYADFNESFNKLDDVTDSISTLQGGIEDADTDNFGIFGVLNSLIATTWNTLVAIFTTFGFFSEIFEGMNTVFGVPLWITGLVSLLVTVVLVFAIWSAIFQREL